LRTAAFVALLAVALASCARHAPPVPIDPASPFARVQKGMGQTEVQAILGPPTDRGPMHMTGKIFAPFYFGDDAFEQTWYYQGRGRVQFSGGAFFPLAVMSVDVDPSEAGYYRR
jgi:hypothetical protein